jgi:hypothetical protein
MDDLPILCTLTPDQRVKRRFSLQEPIRSRLLRVDVLPDGYSYVFPASLPLWMDLQRLVDLERQCCRFLQFKLDARMGERTMRLDVCGPPEAKTIIADLFNL